MITGVSGLLGRHLLELAPPRFDIHGVSRGGFPAELSDYCTMHAANVTDTDHMVRLIHGLSPDVVIHAAAEGNPDTVEGRVDDFRQVNVRSALEIASAARREGAKVIFVSSNAVFSGNSSPYADDSPTCPINDYGRLKEEAERLVCNVHPGALVVRPIMMYGWPFPEGRRNALVDWIAKLRVGLQIQALSDVWTEPLAAWDCATAIWVGVDLDATGYVNVSGGVRVSVYEFAREAATTFDLDTDLVVPVSAQDYNSLAVRPMDTRFTLGRLQNEFHVFPVDPRSGLALMRQSEPQAR